ncbi:uncharacterized protein I303_107587 [Kwoniella dejecticola CBS 10117]|uniref:Uncharacterized protein n=1 Tax=Kwoniella dejecticola CBS 10117 TaxID=1296121 RepID=A0A1A5ZV52_9TREE|nr:uncharacterized protein I303_07597 [Kwoniella dejecticola CBS 10117]OBR81687.1 hypothetical protein I303_07597 [Kwoniella dejecticola CBS 10117]
MDHINTDSDPCSDSPPPPSPSNSPSPEPVETDFDYFDYLYLHFPKGLYTGRTGLRYLTGKERFLYVRYPDKYADDLLPEYQRDSQTLDSTPTLDQNAAAASTTSQTQTQESSAIADDQQKTNARPVPAATKIVYLEPLAVWVDEFIITGRTRDIFRGGLGLNNGSAIEHKVIIKIMRPSEFPDEFPSDPEDPMAEDEGYNTKETAVINALDEDKIYREYLQPNASLQELRVVPRYYGLFEYCDDDQRENEIPFFYMMLLEDVGNEIEGARGGGYPWEWKDKCVYIAMSHIHRAPYAIRYSIVPHAQEKLSLVTLGLMV